MDKSAGTKALIEGYAEAYSKGNKQEVINAFAEDARWHDPVGSPPHVGHQGVSEFWDQTHELADAVELKPTSIYASGNEGAMVFEIRTTIGEQAFAMSAVETFEFDDQGKIKLAKAYWDPADMKPVE